MPDPVATALHRDLRHGLWVQVLGRARKAAPRDRTGAVHAAGSLAAFYLGRVDGARDLADAALARGRHWLGHLARAQAALALGHPGEARTRLTALTPALPEGDPLAAHTVGLARCGILRALGEPEVGYGEALAWLQRATDGDDPLAVEEALVMVGHCAWASDQNDAATGAFEQAWALRRDRDAAPALQAEALDGLGLCARRDGRPFDAVEAHREALARWEAATGVDSGPASACLHRLAQALHHTGDFLAARETMARALLATAELLGREHVDTWITRFEMARYDVDCGDMEDGFPRMVRARAAVAEQLGAQHPVVRAMDRWL